MKKTKMKVIEEQRTQSEFQIDNKVKYKYSELKTVIDLVFKD